MNIEEAAALAWVFSCNFLVISECSFYLPLRILTIKPILLSIRSKTAFFLLCGRPSGYLLVFTI